MAMVDVKQPEKRYTRITKKVIRQSDAIPFQSPESDPLFVKLTKEFEKCLAERRLTNPAFDCRKDCPNFEVCDMLWTAISGDCEDHKMLEKNYRIYRIVIVAWAKSVALLENLNK